MIPALAVLATVIAALIAAGAAYYGTQVGSRTTLEGVRRTLAANRDTERRRELRALQDAAYQRRRLTYVMLLVAVRDMQFRMDEAASGHAQRQDEELRAIILRFNESLDAIRRAEAELLLEGESDAALNGLNTVQRDLFYYLSLLRVPYEGHNADSLTRLADLRADVEAQLLALAALGRTSIAALARPVHDPDDNAP